MMHFNKFVLQVVLSLAPFVACFKGPMVPERAAARSVLLTVAEGVKVADSTCAQVTKSPIDHAEKVKILRACAVSYDVARASLLSTERLVDAWDGLSTKKVACAIMHAIGSLKEVKAALTSAKVEMPEVVDDAIDIALALSGSFSAKECAKEEGAK
jgi:hypothetical protein